jgi:hypothetical protein
MLPELPGSAKSGPIRCGFDRPSAYQHESNTMKTPKDFVVVGWHSAERHDSACRRHLSLRSRYLDACACSSCSTSYSGDGVAFLRARVGSSPAGPLDVPTFANTAVVSTTRQKVTDEVSALDR